MNEKLHKISINAHFSRKNVTLNFGGLFFLFRDQNFFFYFGIGWNHMDCKVTSTYIDSHRYCVWYCILWYLMICVIQFQHHFDFSPSDIVSQMWNNITNVLMHNLQYRKHLTLHVCLVQKWFVSYWISICTIFFYNICKFSNGKYIFNIIICFSN